MKKYEITFVVSENLTEDKAKEISKNIGHLIESRGGKVELDLFWGKKKLAYKIAKNTFGYYFVVVFFVEPNEIQEMNKEIRMNEKILRHLIVDFVEKTPFFEEIAERKNKAAGTKSSEDVIEENIQKEKVRTARKTKEEVKEEIVEEPKVEIEEVEAPAVEEVKEEVKESEEPGVEAEVVESDDKEPEEEKIVEEVKEEVKEPEPAKEEKTKIKKEELAERKADRKKMTDDERKQQLEKKLAELLKEEEE